VENAWTKLPSHPGKRSWRAKNPVRSVYASVSSTVYTCLIFRIADKPEGRAVLLYVRIGNAGECACKKKDIFLKTT